MKSKHECDFCTETCNTISHANYRVCPVCFEKMHSSFKELSALKKDARLLARYATFDYDTDGDIPDYEFANAARRIIEATEVK